MLEARHSLLGVFHVQRGMCTATWPCPITGPGRDTSEHWELRKLGMTYSLCSTLVAVVIAVVQLSRMLEVVSHLTREAMQHVICDTGEACQPCAPIQLPRDVVLKASVQHA